MKKKEIFWIPKKIPGGGVALMKKRKKRIVFLSATRTPFGEVNGTLKTFTPIELGTLAARGAIEQAGLKGREDLIDESIFGNAQHTSIDSHYGGRHVGLRAGLPYDKPGLTVNRICFSGGEAIIQGAKQILLGESEIVLAGGYESPSQAPSLQYGASMGFPFMAGARVYHLFKDGLQDTYTNLDMMGTAERLGKLYGVTREDADEFAFSSQMKGKDAIENGRLVKEITPVTLATRRGTQVISDDEHPRPDVTMESLARLRNVKSGGVQTAGNSSGIVDGGAAVIIADEKKAKNLGLKPIGEIVSWGTAAVDPYYMGIGPVPACTIALKRVGMTWKDVDCIEINEAFAAQYLAVERELKLDRNKVNLNGGAIALGHPLGATGARLVAAVLWLGGIGVASACIGGGQGGAIVTKSYL